VAQLFSLAVESQEISNHYEKQNTHSACRSGFAGWCSLDIGATGSGYLASGWAIHHLLAD
jgi:hypothetical protein